MQDDRDELAEIFERSEARAFGGDSLRITDDGIWMPTPWPVVRSLVAALPGSGVLGAAAVPTILDAGMGDGRLVAALGASETGMHACGIESHTGLHALAVENLGRVPAGRFSLACGSYLQGTTYDVLGVAPDTIDVVLNYPDGNERALMDFFGAHGRRGTHVVFVTPDRALAFPGLEPAAVLALHGGFRAYAYRT